MASVLNDVCLPTAKPYSFFDHRYFALLNGDSREVLGHFRPGSVDMIFADPPYWLSRKGGITFRNGEVAPVKKADWDVPITLEEEHTFNIEWLVAAQKVLKDNGTIWVSGTHHNIYSVGMALKELGYYVLNNVVWEKTNPPRSATRRTLVHSNETIIWAKKSSNSKGYVFNYLEMKSRNGEKAMKDVWQFACNYRSDTPEGLERHPTQKPIKLLERIILASTNEGAIILDPFNGGGTTGIAAMRQNRRYIGIDTESKYLKLTIERYADWISKGVSDA